MDLPVKEDLKMTCI